MHFECKNCRFHSRVNHYCHWRRLVTWREVEIHFRFYFMQEKEKQWNEKGVNFHPIWPSVDVKRKEMKVVCYKSKNKKEPFVSGAKKSERLKG